MERIRIDATSFAAGILGGLSLGLGAGYLLCHRLSRKAQEAEIQEVKNHYESVRQQHLLEMRLAHYKLEDDLKPVLREELNLASASGDAVDGTSAVGATAEELPDSGTASDEERGEDASEPGEEQEKKMTPGTVAGRGTSYPRIVSRDEFGEVLHYQKLTITYYAQDKVLVDDQDQPIRDLRGTTGLIYINKFGGVSGDPNIMYVCNDNLETYFEVVLDRRSYAAVVLEYGNPSES